MSEDPRLRDVPEKFLALDEKSEDDETEDRFPTLSEVGRVLPIGFVDSKESRHRDFDLVEWDFDLELELGEIAEKESSMSMGSYISEIVGRCLTKVGTIDVTSLKRSERRLLVYRMFYSDVLYVYVHVRISALGSKLKLEVFQCPTNGCTNEIKYVGDLNSLEVKVLDDVPRGTVRLDRVVDYGGMRVEALEISGLKWAFMEEADGSVLGNPARAKLATMESGVVGAVGHETPIRVTRDFARKLTSADVNRIVRGIDEINGGAVMQIEGTCKKCRKRFREPIDWSYADFFGRSSL